MTRAEPSGAVGVERIRARLEDLRRSFDEAIREAPQDAASRTEEFLLVRLAGESYGFPVAHALEIVKVPAIVPVPGLPPAIRGIVNFRGRILSVTAIHGLLGLACREPDGESRIVVTKGLPLTTGILVDGLEALAEIALDDVEPLPATLGECEARLLRGQVRVGERLASLLDMEQVARAESLRAAPGETAP